MVGPAQVPPETLLAVGRRVLLLVPEEVPGERFGLLGESQAMRALRA